MLLEEEVQACHLTQEHKNAITRGWVSRDNKYSYSYKTTVRYNGKTPLAATAGPEKSSFSPERVRRQAGTACQGFCWAVRSGEARGAAASWQRGRPGAVKRQRAQSSVNSARQRRLRPGGCNPQPAPGGSAQAPPPDTKGRQAGGRPPPLSLSLSPSLPFLPQPGRAVSPPRPSPAAPHVGEPRRSLLARRGRAAEAGREPSVLSSPPPPPLLTATAAPRLPVAVVAVVAVGPPCPARGAAAAPGGSRGAGRRASEQGREGKRKRREGQGGPQRGRAGGRHSPAQAAPPPATEQPPGPRAGLTPHRAPTAATWRRRRRAGPGAGRGRDGARRDRPPPPSAPLPHRRHRHRAGPTGTGPRPGRALLGTGSPRSVLGAPHAHGAGPALRRSVPPLAPNPVSGTGRVLVSS